MVEFFKSLGGFIMTPLYLAISAILLAWHTLWGNLFGDASGWAWALSIVGLTLVIRAALIPLFVKQIKASRNMQLLQPRLRELRTKYGHDRERFAQEQMKLFKESKTNPFSSCLPLLVQMPIFLALFRLLDQASRNPDQTRGLMTVELNEQFGNAVFLGAQLSDSFIATDSLGVRVLAATLVVIMTATTFLTQRQLMSKNMPADALTGPYAQQQKLLLYVLPVAFGAGGIFFPIGVILYWTTSNLWTMGQQFYVIRNNPAPNTEAFQAKVDRDAAKRAKKGLPPIEEEKKKQAPAVEETERPAARQQPKAQTRAQRKKQGGKQQPPRPQNPRQQSQRQQQHKQKQRGGGAGEGQPGQPDATATPDTPDTGGTS